MLSVKPGITGNWVVTRSENTSYNKRVAMESKYVDNFSIKQDMKILLKTIKIVF